ncbi:MAG: MlaD family protein [Bdellovibrionota bacterium]
MLAIIVLGSSENILVRKSHYYIHFNSVEGLIPGAKVVLGGLQIGTVSTIDFDPEKRNMRIEVSVARTSSPWIRKDTTAEIATLGVLGDKYIALSTSSNNEAPLPQGSDITVKQSKDIAQFLNKGDQLMISLNSLASSLNRLVNGFESNNRSEVFFQNMTSAAKNLATATDKLNKELDGLNAKSVVKNMNSILDKINNGTGTLGALINDPGLYDDTKALIGGANRSRIIRNLVRQTIKKSAETQAGQQK